MNIFPVISRRPDGESSGHFRSHDRIRSRLTGPHDQQKEGRAAARPLLLNSLADADPAAAFRERMKNVLS
jgi:hypothetical protein